MSNNKSNSPFFAIGQGINQLLDYQMIAAAGAPRNFLGLAIGNIGSHISRLDFSEMTKDKETPAELKSVGMGEEYEGFGGSYGKEYDFGAEDPFADLNKFYFLTNKGKEKVTTASTKGGENVEEVEEEDPSFNLKYGFDESNQNAPGINVGSGNTGFDTNQMKNKIGDPNQQLKNEQFFKSLNLKYDKIKKDGKVDFNKILQEEKEKQKKRKEDKLFGKSKYLRNFKKGLPRLKPEILDIIENSRYKRKGKDDTKLHRIGYFARSPFYKTDGKSFNMLAKVAETPGDAFSGLLPNGKNPAIQAYNAVIESENYRRKIKNDFDEDLTAELDTLNVDMTKANITGQQREDLLKLSLNSKKELSGAFQKYAEGKIGKLEYETIKSKLLNEVGMLSSDLGLIKSKAADFLKNKDKIDLEASNPEVADFYQTAIKNPDSLRVDTIGGKKYFIGTTRGGKDFKIEVGAISNGDAGFLLTEKADATTYVKNALTTMQNATIEGQTPLGIGQMQQVDNTTTDENGNLVKSNIRKIGENKLIADFKQNPDMVRSLLAQYRGINYEAYQGLINKDTDGDGIINSDEIRSNEEGLLTQLAEEMYDEFVSPQYNPKSKTTKMSTSGGKGGASTQKERDRLRFTKAWDAAPLPTPENVLGQYGNLINKQKYRIYQNKKGEYGIVSATSGKGIPGSKIDFKNQTPQEIKQKLLTFSQYELYGQGNLNQNFTEEDAANFIAQFENK
tara:strand:+ start:10495 stop:12687 length:2193 start_codon:yes stop_codon:yes gene_type:complete